LYCFNISRIPPSPEKLSQSRRQHYDQPVAWKRHNLRTNMSQKIFNINSFEIMFCHTDVTLASEW
jgi:hypothetical protein